MPLYRYRALQTEAKKQGRISRGAMMAANEAELSQILASMRCELIEAKQEAIKTARGPSFSSGFEAGPIILCRQMEDLLRAGLPFPESLRQIAAAMPEGSFRDALAAILQAITQGSGLRAAFAAHPRFFSAPFLAALAAGEKAGALDRCFAQLGADLRWQSDVSKKIRRALRYPLFLLCVAGGVTSFMMILVVPQIVAFLESFGTALPLSTRLLIGTANILTRFGGPAVALFLMGALALVPLRRFNEGFALFTDRAALRLPFLGDALEKIALARFARTLTLLLQNGLSLPESLDLSIPALANRALIERGKAASEKLVEGAPLSQAGQELFPPFALQMIRIGETSGRLTASLADVTRSYDAEVESVLQRLIGGLEPALTLFVGGILVWIVLAVLGPVYGSLGKLGAGI
jgi:type IV pilus assembly protein PilC